MQPEEGNRVLHAQQQTDGTGSSRSVKEVVVVRVVLRCRVVPPLLTRVIQQQGGDHEYHGDTSDSEHSVDTIDRYTIYGIHGRTHAGDDTYRLREWRPGKWRRGSKDPVLRDLL